MRKILILSMIFSFSILAITLAVTRSLGISKSFAVLPEAHAFSSETLENKAETLSTTAVKNELLSTVMSPEVQSRRMGGFSPKSASFSMARRLDTLDNKTVYLIENGFGGSSRFMEQLQNWFEQYMPAVKTVRKRKPGQVFMDDNADTALWKEVKEKGHAVIMGVAG